MKSPILEERDFLVMFRNDPEEALMLWYDYAPAEVPEEATEKIERELWRKLASHFPANHFKTCKAQEIFSDREFNEKAELLHVRLAVVKNADWEPIFDD